MNLSTLVALLPHLSIAIAILAVTMMLTVKRNHVVAVVLTIVGLLAAAALAPLAAREGPHAVTALLVVDSYSEFFIGLVSLSGVALALLAYDYWKTRTANPEEYYILLLLATLGTTVLVSSTHFASAFLGLEILSVSLYGMIAYRRQEPLGVEAALKYLILAGASSAFLLFGMALIYSQVGSMQFSALSATEEATVSHMVEAGLALMLVGIGFKLALVPFHFWTPDVYQGASAPAAAFIATVSKGAVLAFLIRLFAATGFMSGSIRTVVTLLAITSMFAGNFLALRQHRVKRILAYSSIAHMGYLLVALLAEPPAAERTVAFYLVAYFVSMTAAFGALGAVSSNRKDADFLHDFRGLVWRRPGLAAVISGAVFSLAGIPLTAGFFAKFQILATGINADLRLLVLILVVNSAIGLYYYLRMIVAMYEPEPGPVRNSDPTGTSPNAVARLSLASGVALSALSFILVWLGVYPGPLLSLLQTIAIGAG